jgi:hypothetical protein
VWDMAMDATPRAGVRLSRALPLLPTPLETEQTLRAGRRMLQSPLQHRKGFP